MKKHLLTLVAIVPMLIACSSPEKKAQDLITNYLKVELNNFDRYNPLSWGELEPVDVLIEHYDAYKIAKNGVEEQKRRLAEAEESKKNALELGVPEDHEIIRQIDSQIDTQESHLRYYELDVKSVISAFPYIDGYSMKHSYEWVNALGETVKTDEIFYFDKDLKKVVCTEK